MTSTLAVEVWPIERVIPYARNPRKNQAAVAKVAASLREFGWRQPIVVDESGTVIVGHTRLMAAQQLGMTEVPVHVAAGLTAAQAKAYRIADNRTGEEAEWDFELLSLELTELRDAGFDLDLTGFDADGIAEMFGQAGEVVEDEVPPPPAKPITQPGDLILLGRHRLLCGDSTKTEDVARVMDGKRADCVFTSPPYAVGIDYGGYDDTIENLRAMIPKLSARWCECVRDGGYAVVNFGDIVSASKIVGTDEPCEYPMALEYWPPFRADGWVLWSRRAWCKPCAGTGSMQCIGSNRAATNWENVWTWKRPGKAIHDKQTTGEFASQNGWIDSTHGHKLGVGLKDHGAGMPVMVAAFAIGVHSLDGGIVHEPFCGTGTTLIAAEQLNRTCCGIEISPAYCDVIVTRWETLTGQKAVRP